MNARYRHTCIIARDWRALANFYETVFGCVRVPPERDLTGEWVERGVGAPVQRASGVHLRLPGTGESGPTLEIYSYGVHEPRPAPPLPNREGYAHMAFEVDDVEAAFETGLAHGGHRLGEIVTGEIPGAGGITFVYMTDPEGNIIELQKWS
jgi:glyoxylase I family protein